MYRITNRSKVDGVNVTVCDVLLAVPAGGHVDCDVNKEHVTGLPRTMFDVARISKAEADEPAVVYRPPSTPAPVEEAGPVDDSDDQDDDESTDDGGNG